mmetsp:Transcript_20086/g.32686  ORF Transcript_20086/g.32686 Transcript_20086/m.32686 type:complete len:213 (-) Transcript_20086:1089-1727(-)
MKATGSSSLSYLFVASSAFEAMYLHVSPAASLFLCVLSVKLSGKANTKSSSSTPPIAPSLFFFLFSSALVYSLTTFLTTLSTSFGFETAQSWPIVRAYSFLTVALGSDSPLVNARSISPDARSSAFLLSGPAAPILACMTSLEANLAQPVNVGSPRPCRTRPAIPDATCGTEEVSPTAASKHTSRASCKGDWETCCKRSLSSCSSVRSIEAA